MSSPVLRAEADTLSWVSVKSSNVAAVAYSASFSRLFIRFKDSSIYAYDGVPRGIYEGLLVAPSKGQYIWAVVRGKGSDSVYAYQKV